MRVLLTGASGFLGRHTLDALLAGDHEIFAASRGRPMNSGRFEWRQVDLLAEGEARRLVEAVRPDIVLHLGWSATPGRFWTDGANLDWIRATLALAKTSIDGGAKRFCMAGTSYEYAWPDDGDCHEAQTPLAAHTLYDVSKDACRRAIQAYTDQAGASFAWACLFNFFGFWEHPDRLVASVARSIVAGKPALCSSGRVLRDFMDARDAGVAIGDLALSKVEGRVNVASGAAVSIADLALSLGRLAGRADLVRIGGLPDRANEPPRITADVGRLRGEVGFRPRFSLDDGLRDALAFWSEARGGGV